MKLRRRLKKSRRRLSLCLNLSLCGSRGTRRFDIADWVPELPGGVRRISNLTQLLPYWTAAGNWTKSKVDFLTCLMGIIRSLSSHIRTGESRDAFDDLAPVPERHDDGVEDPLERFPNSRMVDPHRELEARELDEQIRERFKDDAEALLIYECFGQRMAPAEIRNLLELSVQQFDAAAKRLRRGVQRLRGGSRL